MLLDITGGGDIKVLPGMCPSSSSSGWVSCFNIIPGVVSIVESFQITCLFCIFWYFFKSGPLSLSNYWLLFGLFCSYVLLFFFHLFVFLDFLSLLLVVLVIVYLDLGWFVYFVVVLLCFLCLFDLFLVYAKPCQTSKTEPFVK